MITVSKKCIEFIQSFEAFRSAPYHGEADAPNIFTIGYGTIKYPPYFRDGKVVTLQDNSITEAQALNFLEYEINYKVKYVDPFLRDDLSPNQFAALVSFAYNLGEYALRTSTLLKKINLNKLDTTIRDEFMRWVHADGKEVPGLKRRRKEEADLYFTT